MKHLFIYPYKIGSRSATALARALDVPQIKHERSKFVGVSFKTVINWGSSGLPQQALRCTVLNDLNAVRRAGNKLSFFKDMTAVSDEARRPRVVPWTTDIREAQEWQTKGHTVFSRTILNGHSGSGIIVCEPNERLPEAPLYTKYVVKDSEWRLHFMRGVRTTEGRDGEQGSTGCFYSQRKIKDPDVEQPKTWKIRSHDNGFIFQHNDISVPPDVLKQATLAFEASKLDFGGVDAICTKKGNGYVLEINCAVGLEGESVRRYSEAFVKLIGSKRR